MKATWFTSIVAGLIMGVAGKFYDRLEFDFGYLLLIFFPSFFLLVIGIPTFRNSRQFLKDNPGLSNQFKREYIEDYLLPVWVRMFIWFVAAVISGILLSLLWPSR